MLFEQPSATGTVDACSIVNAKAGNCAEDCGFCAQSAHFDTGIDTHSLLDPEAILEAATRAERDGAQWFGIVVAEKGVSKDTRPTSGRTSWRLSGSFGTKPTWRSTPPSAS
jgi:biotin synthase